MRGGASRFAEDDFPRPSRITLIGDGREITEEETAARIAMRRPGKLTDVDIEAIGAMVDQFEDVTARAGCVKSGKARRDRLFVTLYLTRRFSGLGPLALAESLGLDRGYVRFCLRR